MINYYNKNSHNENNRSYKILLSTLENIIKHFIFQTAHYERGQMHLPNRTSNSHA